MAEKLDPQVQVRIMELAREWMLEMRPVFPKSRMLESAIANRIETFARLYKEIVQAVTSE